MSLSHTIKESLHGVEASHVISKKMFLLQYVREQHNDWEMGPDSPFTFHSELLELVLEKEDLKKGWKILPQIHPCQVIHFVLSNKHYVYLTFTSYHQIRQKDVDGRRCPEPISCDVTLITQESTAEFLHYPVEIKGINPKGKTIFLQRNPWSPGW